MFIQFFTAARYRFTSHHFKAFITRYVDAQLVAQPTSQNPPVQHQLPWTSPPHMRAECSLSQALSGWWCWSADPSPQRGALRLQVHNLPAPSLPREQEPYNGQSLARSMCYGRPPEAATLLLLPSHSPCGYCMNSASAIIWSGSQHTHLLP